MKTQKQIITYFRDNNIRDGKNLFAIDEYVTSKNLHLPKTYKIHNRGITLIDFIRWFESKTAYPKTYKECCIVLDIPNFCDFVIGGLTKQEVTLYVNFIKLIRCRDAYLKIYSEDNNLDELWKPSLTNCHLPYYSLYTTGVTKDIEKECEHGYSWVLTFPTEEMRDAFYGNFKDLIEKCKELL